MATPRVFVSYSHDDESVVESLLPYLVTLEREALITVWSDRQIKEGERWHEQIDAALAEAAIAVLLISQNFLASPFVHDEELPRILRRQLEGQLTVLPVFVSPSTVSSDAIVISDAFGEQRRIVLSAFQGFGTPEETLSELDVPERQRRFVALHNRIRALSANPRAQPEKTSADQPVLERHDTAEQRPRIKRIPLPRNRTFTGREDYLRRLHEGLRSGKPAAVTQALAGLGGIGKTQLALEYSYRYDVEYDVVWWIRAEHEDTRLDDLRALGHALGIDRGIDATLVVEKTIEWLDRHNDWLLVFDNVEHPDRIRSLLPKSGRGQIIITSRYPAWGDVAQTVSLSRWSIDEAASYLSLRTGATCGPAAAAVAEALGYLPLALAQAAAYVEETGCGFDGYLTLLQQRPVETLKLRANSSDAERAVATVWDIAFERVAASNPGAVDLLHLFAFLAPDRIPRRLLGDGLEHLPPSLQAIIADPIALDNAVGALRRYSLVETTPDAFSVHRLVQIVVRARLDNDTYRQASEAAKNLLEETPPSSSPKPTKLTRRRWTPAQVAGAIGALVVVFIAAIEMNNYFGGVTGMFRRAQSGNTTTAKDTADIPESDKGSAPKSPPIPLISNAFGINFDGIQAADSAPPDTTGAVGPHHYIQTAGDSFAVHDKAGKQLLGPSSFQALWKGFGGLCERGDKSSVAVMYDQLADRWLLAQAVAEMAALDTKNQEECIAVSKTGDPLSGGWHLYGFNLAKANSAILRSWRSGRMVTTWEPWASLEMNSKVPMCGSMNVRRCWPVGRRSSITSTSAVGF